VESSQSERQEGRAQNVKAEVPEAVKRVANVAAPSWIQQAKSSDAFGAAVPSRRLIRQFAETMSEA
jgi:hypothetical protein